MILSRFRGDYRRGMNWILDLLIQLGNTGNYNTIADLRTLQITAAKTLSLLQLAVPSTAVSW
jgi:hypothetical protein